MKIDTSNGSTWEKKMSGYNINKVYCVIFL